MATGFFYDGKEADSMPEVYSVIYLLERGETFNFHVSIDGGTVFPGGQEVDFVVRIGAIWQPVNVGQTGEYWHRNRAWERWKRSRQRMIWKICPIDLPAKEMVDYEATKEIWDDMVFK